MRKEEDFPRNASRSGGQNRAGQAGTNADAAERAREDLLRRVPPHSVEAEQAVLSGVFLRPDLLHNRFPKLHIQERKDKSGRSGSKALSLDVYKRQE